MLNVLNPASFLRFLIRSHPWIFRGFALIFCSTVVALILSLNINQKVNVSIVKLILTQTSLLIGICFTIAGITFGVQSLVSESIRHQFRYQLLNGYGGVYSIEVLTGILTIVTLFEKLRGSGKTPLGITLFHSFISAEAYIGAIIIFVAFALSIYGIHRVTIIINNMNKP